MKSNNYIIPRTPWTASGLWSLEFKPLSVLFISLSLIGVGEGLLVSAEFGSAPWTILSQGVSLQAGFSIGWASLLISSIVMLLWFPLKMKPGIGTLLNMVVISFFLGLTTAYLNTPTEFYIRLLYAFIGILLFGIGTAFYLTCHQGSGPRDGLTVGLCYRFQRRIGAVRTLIEISVCLLGFLLGGTLGFGTFLFALSIGWVVQWTLQIIFINLQQPNYTAKPNKN